MILFGHLIAWCVMRDGSPKSGQLSGIGCVLEANHDVSAGSAAPLAQWDLTQCKFLHNDFYLFYLLTSLCSVLFCSALLMLSAIRCGESRGHISRGNMV